MKTMKKVVVMVVVGMVVGFGATSQAHAAVDLGGVVLDTASVLSLATIILTAIGAIWGIKKLIKLANRS